MVTGFSTDQLLQWYRVMRRIRAFEDRVHAEAGGGDLPGAVHLYAGQEAIAAGVAAHLGPEDYVASTHRGHGHAIAQGCDLTAMMLEIFGKAGGLCGGKGGSMHIADFDRGMLGANGVAAGGVPLACGAALSARVRGTGQVAVGYVGDGGANQGVFAESLNFAAVMGLPVVFVVENNGYAQATPVGYHLHGRDVADRAAGFGMPGVVVDGTDFFAVYEAAGQAVRRARAGGGPTLLECKAGRFYGHMEGFDDQRYRPDGEVERLRAGDCLALFADRVAGRLFAAELAAEDAAAQALVEQAVAIARQAPDPDPATLSTDVYASY